MGMVRPAGDEWRLVGTTRWRWRSQARRSVSSPTVIAAGLLAVAPAAVREALAGGGLAGEFPGTSASQRPAAKLGLGVFLAVVGSLFALSLSAYVMRMEMADWRPLPAPSILWFNTGLLILSSIALQWAPRAEPCATRIGTPRIGIHKDGCSPRRTSLIAQESSLPRIIGQAGLSRQQSATPSLSSAVASAGSPRTEARTTSMAAPARCL